MLCIYRLTLRVLHLFVFAALRTMGIKEFDEYPPGSEVNKITRDTFLREA